MGDLEHLAEQEYLTPLKHPIHALYVTKSIILQNQ